MLKIHNGKIISYEYSLIEINTTFVPDSNMCRLLTPYIDKANASLKDNIAVTSDTFEFGDKLSRKKEIALGDLVNDGITWYVRNILKKKVDFAFINGGTIRAELPCGTITNEDIANVLPFDNYVYMLKVKGSDVIDLFEYMESIKQGSGAWAQVSKELRYIVTYSLSGLGKISDISINGKSIDDSATYVIATNDYLANGGDGYEVLKRSIDIYNTSVNLRDAVTEYVK